MKRCLSADNCADQNKNNLMVQYLMWRTLTGWHSTVHYSFRVWQTKFAHDWSFGLFKRLFKCTKVGSIAEIEEVVNQSAVCNVAQVVCHEDRSMIVPMYNWSTLLASHFKKIVGIKKFHHFRMLSSTPGILYVKEHTDTEEVSLTLLRDNWQPNSASLPPRLEPQDLSNDRKWYLYEHIHQFYADEQKDVACPRPTVPKLRHHCTPGLEDETNT